MAINNFTGTPTDTPSPPPSGDPFPLFGMTQDSDDDFVEQTLINYNEKFQNDEPALFRNKIVEQTMGVLIGKNKPNPLLIGAAGVGKTKIAEEIARRIVTDDPVLPKQLQDCTVYELPLSNIVAGSGIVGQVEEKIKSIIDFASDPDNKAILFIDEIHQLSSSSTTYENIAQILKPALARGDMKVIGATTLQESKHLMDDPALNRRFTRIIVDELTREQAIVILQKAKNGFINHYRGNQAIGSYLAIDDATLESIAYLADQYSSAGSNRPDNALTLLDRACGDAIIARQIQLETLSSRIDEDPKNQNLTMLYQNLKTQAIPLTTTQIKKTAIQLLTGNSKREPLRKESLKKALQSIKGQKEIINVIIKTLLRDEKGLYPRKRPLTFLFAGESGVGKTEISKIISNVLTNNEPIVLNMTEYHDPASINRLVGSPAGYVGYESNAELPFDKLETNPYQVILLDEFEKGDRSVQRLFMNAFEEGFITTSRNKKIDFSKSIIIATTNAGYDGTTSHTIGFNSEKSEIVKKQEIVDTLTGSFDLALLNRFDEILKFNQITIGIYEEILDNIYQEDIARIKNDRRNVPLPDRLSEKTIKAIAKRTYIPEFGARPARRTIQEYIENSL